MFKRIVQAMLIGILMFSYVSAKAVGDQVSLIENGGIEDEKLSSEGIPKGWAMWGAKEYKKAENYKRDTTVKHTGKASLRFHRPANTDGYIITDPRHSVPLKPNTDYTFSLWLYAKEETKVKVNLSSFSSITKFTDYEIITTQDVNVKPEWQKIILAIKSLYLNADVNKYLLISLKSIEESNIDVTYWVDDVTVETTKSSHSLKSSYMDKTVLTRFQPDPKLPPELGVPYVIITTESLAPSFQRLVEWKRSIGMPVLVVTLEWLAKNPSYPGVDLCERIYYLLQDLCLNWKTRWVLIGGDVDIVPPQKITAKQGGLFGDSIPCDIYYTDVLPADRGDAEAIETYGWNANGDRFIGEFGKDGFDLVPELYVSRIPVDTPREADDFFDKYFEYVNPQENDLSWLSRILVVGANQFRQSQTQLAESFRQLVEPDCKITLLVEKEPDPIKAITEELNKGCAFYDFYCHGCPTHVWACDDRIRWWGVNNVKTLMNKGMYPVVFQNSCGTGDFEKEDCLAEVIVLKPKAGAIASFAYSHVCFGSPIHQDLYKLIFSGDCPQIARALAEAKQKDARNTWPGQMLHLFGEPEMWVRTTVPQQIKTSDERFVVNIPARLTVTDASGKPQNNARVLLEAAPMYLVGTTDTSGVVRLSPPSKSGAAKLVVFAQNGFRYEKKVNVDAKLPAGFSCAIPKPVLTIDDSIDSPEESSESVEVSANDSSIRLRGNNQKDLNQGETVKFVFSWPKDFQLPSGTLSLAFEDDPFVKCLAGPEMPDKKTAIFTVRVLGNVPSWHQVWLTLSFTLHQNGTGFNESAGSEPWIWTFRQPVEGPAVTCLAVTIDDSEGNKDKRIGWEDAGKKLRFSVGLYNSGTQKTSNLKITATSTDSAVKVLKGVIQFGILPCDDLVHPKDKCFEFQLADDYDGHSLEFSLLIEDTRRIKWQTKIIFTIPPASPLFLTTKAGLKRVVLSWFPGGGKGVVGYHVYRSNSEKGPFTQITERPIPIKSGTRFLDTTVKPMTIYYYVVTSVTADGLESRYSNTVRGWTLSPLPRVSEKGEKNEKNH